MTEGLPRLRVLGVSAILALVLLAVGALAACGSAPTEGSTPGFREPSPRSTEPFILARPRTQGSTTLAPGFFDTTTTASTTTTTTAPTTTTSDPEPPLYLPATADIRNICGLTRAIASLFPPDPLPNGRVRELLDTALPNFDRYVEVAPPALRPDVVGIRDVLVRLEKLFTEGGDRIDYPPLVVAVVSLTDGTPPNEAVPQQLQAISLYESASC